MREYQVLLLKKPNKLPSLFAIKKSVTSNTVELQLYTYEVMVSKQVLMKNYQNKRHVIGIISVGRHLSAILNTCKYPAIKYTHFCIKTKMIKNYAILFF